LIGAKYLSAETHSLEALAQEVGNVELVYEATGASRLAFEMIRHLIGMLAATELYIRARGTHGVMCAKLHHENTKRCIFCGKPAEEQIPVL
jgi:hypothetical protein